MRVTKMLNARVHSWMVQFVRRQYHEKVRLVLQKNSQLKQSVDKSETRRHLEFWNRLLPRCKEDWFRQYVNTSGLLDYRFVPEDVFYGVIERCLNNCDSAGFGVEDKSDVCFYIPKQFQPRAYLRYVRGVYFDDEFNPLTQKEAQDVLSSLECDVVGKPSSGSCGGSNVRCFKRDGSNKFTSKNVELSFDWIEKNFEAYVVQERVIQEHKTAAFNRNSLNTCRMMTFRRPWSGEVTVIATMLRTGCSDEIVDNLAAGGVSVDVDSAGNLASFAVDKYFRKHTKHPATGVVFEGFSLPYYDLMAKTVCDVAKHVPGHNLLSFDIVVREDGTPCIIEINATSMTLSQLQTCRPLFGEETERVVEWCVSHKDKFQNFKHIRTFY